jgi:hypothetical protein
MPETHGPTDEQIADGDFGIAYLCLFCGQSVEQDAPDFCEINVSAPAGYATFTSHAGCLREAAHDPEIFPDIETRAEPPEGYEPPSPEFVGAWDELVEVLAQIQEAEIDDAGSVRQLTYAVEQAALQNGVSIEREA